MPLRPSISKWNLPCCMLRSYSLLLSKRSDLQVHLFGSVPAYYNRNHWSRVQPLIKYWRIKQISTIATATKTDNMLSSISVASAAIDSASNPAATTETTLISMLAYTKYPNISHSTRLEATFIEFQDSQGVIDSNKTGLTNVMKRGFDQKILPGVYERYNVSSTFLLSFWFRFCSLLTVSGVVLLIIAMNYRVARLPGKKLLKHICLKLKYSSQNYLLAQLYYNYANVMLFAGPEFRAMSISTSLSIFSLFVAILFVIICTFILSVHVWIIRTYQKLKKQDKRADDKENNKLEQFKTCFEGMKSLFGDSKDESFFQQAF